MTRVLASVGTQMSAFVHEIQGLLATAESVDRSMERLRKDPKIPKTTRAELGRLHQVIADLRRSLERQASYLTDIVTPDARRRRSRQRLAERFEAARRLVESQAAKRAVTIQNNIPAELESPPMFPAELTVLFANVLTNAVKACDQGGTILATAESASDGSTAVRVENTGTKVNLRDGERWFRPFESTTKTVDPVLGQGMGMGLPITRSLVEEYGGTVQFVRPSPAFKTAVEIRLPSR